MSIYTRTGDSGFTSLLGGQRVSKSDPAPEACGTVDELNVETGVLLNLLDGAAAETLAAELRRIQRRLFSVGSRLASASAADAAAAGVEPPGPRDCAWMEAAMDRMQQGMEPLQAFILPGGHAAAVQAHRARTVCRRAERRVVALAEHLVERNGCHHVQADIMYLNRLADYLFVAARYCNHCAGVPETAWRQQGARDASMPDGQVNGAG